MYVRNSNLKFDSRLPALNSQSYTLCFWEKSSLLELIFLFIWNGSNAKNKNLFSDQAQAPHQDGTPRTPQLMSEPKTAGSILLLFKLFPDLKHLLEVGNQITII